jgi:hypothetical protein
MGPATAGIARRCQLGGDRLGEFSMGELLVQDAVGVAVWLHGSFSGS